MRSARLDEQRALFTQAHPNAAAEAERASNWRGGVPMHWMTDWATPFPIVVERAEGAILTDIDACSYDDFCLGDTPSMYGHARPELAKALSEQAAQGFGYMLPTRASARVAQKLSQRFGLAQWQMATTASDANRAAIRWARAVTERPKVLVFDGCYHGMVEDCFVTCEGGRTLPKPGQIGARAEQTAATVCVPFNDIEAVRQALAGGDIAAILAEPVMTNCGMIAPVAGYWEAVRPLCLDGGTLLILDETHTLSSEFAGYGREHGLEPDMFVVGKAIAGGIPAAVWGVTHEVAARMSEAEAKVGAGSSGIGTTLSGNALAVQAIEVMLDEVITPEAVIAMLEGAARLEAGLKALIAERGLDWCVVRVGARLELIFAPAPPLTAAEMRRHLDHDLLELFHLYLINKGVLIAPFHNMMLISPVTSTQAIDRLVAAVADFAHYISEDLT